MLALKQKHADEAALAARAEGWSARGRARGGGGAARGGA